MVRSLYDQLVSESRHETFDERRVTLLKSQNIQLERQVGPVLRISPSISSSFSGTVVNGHDRNDCLD